MFHFSLTRDHIRNDLAHKADYPLPQIQTTSTIDSSNANSPSKTLLQSHSSLDSVALDALKITCRGLEQMSATRGTHAIFFRTCGFIYPIAHTLRCLEFDTPHTRSLTPAACFPAGAFSPPSCQPTNTKKQEKKPGTFRAKTEQEAHIQH